MSVSVFPVPTGGGATGAQWTTLAVTLTNGRFLLREPLAAGIYTFVGTADEYNVNFYDDNGDYLAGTGVLNSGNFTVTVPSAAALMDIGSELANASLVVTFVGSGADDGGTVTLITNSQSVTINAAAKVFLLGGGGGGANKASGPGGGGSGYLTVGNLAAGTYSATIGAGGAAGATGGTTSISNLTAAGGVGAFGNAGGDGGSGGGAGVNYNNIQGTQGGYSGNSALNSNQGDVGGSGSGVNTQGFIGGGASGGVYRGGAGRQASGGGAAATGYGGGGTGTAAGFQGAIIIREGF